MKSAFSSVFMKTVVIDNNNPDNRSVFLNLTEILQTSYENQKQQGNYNSKVEDIVQHSQPWKNSAE